MSPDKFIYSGNLKQEKTLSERHQNNTTIGLDYLTFKKQFLYSFSFKNVPFFVNKKINLHSLAAGVRPPTLADWKMQVFFTCSYWEKKWSIAKVLSINSPYSGPIFSSLDIFQYMKMKNLKNCENRPIITTGVPQNNFLRHPV